MALNQKTNPEQICDLDGQLLQADGAVLLKSLDKLLTMGAYYARDHEQYLLASEEAARTIAAAIRPRPTLGLEITSEGLMILGQRVSPNHRHVRQVHDLLVPLNIARLEIDAGLTAEDLRLALAVLQDHRLRLGHADTFQEIVIEDLPPTVRSVSRSVLRRESGSSLDAASQAGIQEMLEEWSRGGGSGQEEEDESEKLAREFMQLVTGILENLANLGECEIQDMKTLHGSGKALLSPLHLEALKEALRRLVEVKPSPRELLQLIAHARSALDLSRDVGRVDLVFQILQKDILKGVDHGPFVGPGSAREIRYEFGVEQLLAAVSELEQDGVSPHDPAEGVLADHMAIGLYLLASQPQESLRQSILDSLQDLFRKPGVKAKDLAPCVAAIREALSSGFVERADSLVTDITSVLRRSRPELVGSLWFRLQETVQPEDLPILWPHLLNDILLGLGRVSAEVGREVLLWAGRISPEGAMAQLERLEAMPALQSETAAGDLFKAPLPKLYAVHAALARTRLAPWLGRGIHGSMKARPFNPVVRALMIALDYQPANLDFYLDLIAQAGSGTMNDRLRSRAAVLLLGLLADLPRVRRGEKWVPTALEGLARLEVEEAGPLLDDVLNARRFIFFKAWPEVCREAVARARAMEGV